MGTDLVTVLKKLEEFKKEALYWFQCIGLETPSEFTESMKESEEFLRELATVDPEEGFGVGRDVSGVVEG